jgi:hypothetical protein
MWLNYLQLALLLLLPLLISVPIAVAYWSVLSKPWLFAITGIAGSHLIYGLCIYYFDSYRGKVAVSDVTVNQAATNPQEKYQVTVNGDALAYFLQPYVLGIVVFILVCVPLLLGLAHFMRRGAV